MLRTINQTLAMFKKEDEGTAITKYFLRQLCKDVKIKFILAGTKFIIDVKDLRAYLENPNRPKPNQEKII